MTKISATKIVLKASTKKPIKANFTPSNIDKNQLYYGDNLDVLRNKILTNSVDLCYIDPPFNSKRNYFQIYNNQGSEDRAQSQAFIDTWEWKNEAQTGLDYILNLSNQNKFTPQTVALIKGLEQVLGRGDLFAYLIHMTLRIVEIHRVLKDTGTFYLHCDPTASHYLKLILDSVFCGMGQRGDFLNEILWCYSGGGRSKNDFAKKHDTIFRYSKSDTYCFNADDIRIAYNLDTSKRTSAKSWGSHGNDVEYGPNPLGKIPEDWWQISPLNSQSKERLGYPTQKPEALLERIIRASSNKGDVVLDAYCGCGTTVAVAQRLKRRWIGIDITYQSIGLILKRLQDRNKDKWKVIESNLFLDGIPRDLDSAKALANRKDDKTRKEFEKWALLTYTDNQARINEKKGADGGIDGVAFFMSDSNQNGKAVFQVKSGGASRSTIATLNSDRLREGAEFGILITMDSPTKAMLQEAQLVGKYKHPLLKREDDHIQIITIESILNGDRLNLPMSRLDHVKSAEFAGDADNQQDLI